MPPRLGCYSFLGDFVCFIRQYLCLKEFFKAKHCLILGQKAGRNLHSPDIRWQNGPIVFGQNLAILTIVYSTMLHRAERGDLNAVIVRQT